MIAILGAFSPEVEPFAGFLGRASARCFAVGVGLVESAIGTARVLERERPDLVLFVGTAGAFAQSQAAVGVAYAIERVQLEESHEAHLPSPPMRKELTLSSYVPDLPRASVVTTVGITTSDARAESLWQYARCDLEHLELFSVALACEVANVPCAAVLGVTNVVGSRGRSEWAASHREVSRAVAALVGPKLAALVSSI